MKPMLGRAAAVFFLSCLVLLPLAHARGMAAPGLSRYRIPLSDACFAVGLIETGFGLLLLISRTGFFDIFAYGAHSLLVLFTLFRRPEDLPDYLTWRALHIRSEKRLGQPLLVSGITLLFLSAILLI